MKKYFFVVCCTFLTLQLTTSLAQADGDGYSEITAPEAKVLQEKNSDAVIVNVLSKLEFEIQHIPNSISIPINQFETTSLLPEDKNAPILTYCMGAR
ncbi:MAG: rhodanese-like domain-containing protein [Thermodesulfobacteriota bacterium]